MRSFQFAEHDRETLREFGAAGAVLVLPLGAIEQHGPHLPVWTDTLVVEHVARAAVERAGDQARVLLGPTLPFGSSAHHVPFGGTLSLDTGVYLDVLMNLGRSAQQAGFRRLFLLNGHGGNHELAQLAARDLSLQLDIDVAAASWWRAAWDELAATEAADYGRVPGHAGAFETALVTALRPDLVGPLPPPHAGPHATTSGPASAPVRVERAGFWQSISGYTDQPGAIPAELGNRLVEIIVSSLTAAIVAFSVEGR